MTAEHPQETKASASGIKWTWIPMPLWAMLASFGASLLFALTPLWQFALVSGAIGGLLSRRMKWGAIAGCLGTALGWFTYMGISFLTTQSFMLLGQVAGIIFGSTDLVGILVLLVTLIGALFGTLGGSIGSGVRILLEARKSR